MQQKISLFVRKFGLAQNTTAYRVVSYLLCIDKGIRLEQTRGL